MASKQVHTEDNTKEFATALECKGNEPPPLSREYWDPHRRSK